MGMKFPSTKDKEDCVNYCLEVCQKKRIQPTLQFMTAIAVLEVNSDPDVINEFWDSFLELLSSSYERKTADDLKTDYPWGIWRINSQAAIDGASTVWKGTTSRHDSGAYQVHTYEVPLLKSSRDELSFPDDSSSEIVVENDDIVWKLLIAKQEGRDVLVGSVNVAEIDASCMVPHLPNFAATNQGSMLLASWSLDKNKGLSEWQRRPDPVRIQSIANFINASKNNLIINSIMLYIPEDAAGVSIEKDDEFATITIRPQQFLVPKGSELTDVSISEVNGEFTYTDHRPLWIVDGQHRTRGMALSYRGTKMDVPVVITHGGAEGNVELGEVAKVFTEINTLATPLDSFQQHYLSHKFSIASGDVAKTYGPPDKGLDEKDRKNRLANIRMYQLACLLTQEEGGPFENGVQLVDGIGAAIMTRIKLNEFVKQMRPAFVSGFYSDTKLTIESIHTDFSNYLAAWSNTANHHKWGHMPNRLRWEPNRSNSSELEQSQPIVWIIFKTFQFIRNVAETRELELSEKTYTEILSPVRGIDWYSKEMETRFFKKYRPFSVYMSTWIKQAIINNQIRSPDEITSTNIANVDHGTALHAYPSEPIIESTMGALSTVVTLTWKHGNVYDEPSECYLLDQGKKIDIEDAKWTFKVPDGTESEASIATFEIIIENLEEFNDDWQIVVAYDNVSKSRDLIITNAMLSEEI
jgi:DGQHR domain-containing protein